MHSETSLHIGADHPAFAGHFPHMPIVPGVLLIDAAVHAASRLLGRAPSDEAQADSTHSDCRISSAKFLSPVGPDETLTISCTRVEPDSVRFDIRSGARKVATGTLILASAP